MLNINELQVTINNKILLNIDQLSISEGKIFSVLGKNGAGKSTLFKAITGEIKSTGHRLLHQQAISNWPKNKLAKHLAVLPQNNQLSFSFTAKEVVALGLIPLTIKQRSGMLLVTEMMKLTDTLPFANRSYLSLSGGEKQRIHLARVLVQLSQAEKPPLLLLDEPTSAQDLAQQHQVLQLTQLLCHEKHFSALLIMHDLNLSMRYSDIIGLLTGGSFNKIGPPQQILSPDIIESQWGYRPQKIETQTGECLFI